MTFLGLLDKVLNNKYKDLFMVRLGSTLLLTKLGVIGVAAKAATPFVTGFIGIMVESGIFTIDLTLDAIKEGIKLEEFHKHAKEAYDYATKKVYTEEEKEKIRKQYLEIISRIGTVGERPK